jgi:trans-2-enoyl-CoA reductase
MNPIQTIQVVPTSYTQTIKQVEVASIAFATSSSIIININLRDANQVFIKNTSLTMSGSDFSNWQNSNTFLQNWILTQLNLIAA